MRRRDFMLTGLGLTAGLSLGASRSVQAQPASLPIIDAHCHIFNADDLPVIGFLKKIAAHGRLDFEKYPRKIRESIDYILNEIIALAREKSPNARREADRLKDGDRLLRGSSADYAVAIALIRRIKSLAGQGPRARRRLPGGNFTGWVANEAYGQIRMELFPNQYGFGPGLKNPYIYDDAPPEEDIADEILVNPGAISKLVRWAIGFTNYRIQLARKLDAYHDKRTVLATPALIDYTHWLDDGFETRLDDQIAAMGEIARVGARCRVHGYAPFDPLRQALFEIGREATGSSIERVGRAIADHGFIGVKLYPPMGFRAIGNAGIANAEFYRDFPHLRRKYPKLRIGAALDGALRKLYAWCQDNGVPIMAHGAHSNGPSEAAMDRAAPEFWGDVASEFPGLRISLAHFGDFEQGLVPGTPLSRTWEYRIATLMQKHPNLYADISYFHSAFLRRDHTALKEAKRMFGTTAQAFDGLLPQRLLYGSDWVMLGVEPDFETQAIDGGYPARVEAVLRDIRKIKPVREGGKTIQKALAPAFDDDAIKAILSTNAARFLGLGATSRAMGNRGRLEAFYARHGLDASWLVAFDPL